MAHYHLNDLLNEDFDPAAGRHARRVLEPALRRANLAGRGEHAVVDEILAHTDVGINPEITFTPTFSSSRYERLMILNYLGPFYDRGEISDVLHKVKGGKEANVYCCVGGPRAGLPLVAAKVYRPRQFRNLRNDALYRQGREVLDARGKPQRDRRALVASATGTRKGKEMQHVSWLAHEFLSLRLLHAAGVSVPRPLAQGNNTILMEYVGEETRPAPALNEVTLATAEAAELYGALLADVATMLACGRVHADLSAYNVLYTGRDYRIIDFPQAVDPAVHPEARRLFERDIRRLCDYFARYGIGGEPDALAAQLWEAHGPARPDGPVEPPGWMEEVE